MSTSTAASKRGTPSVADRVDALDWSAVSGGLDDVGVALTGLVLDRAECRSLVELYGTDRRFRSTIDMARHRFGEGQYRYFDHPLPGIVVELRAAFWPHLLPVAREWAARRAQPAPWPDDLDDWLERCHTAKQKRPTPLMLRYGPGDWNALHRDLYGELVFPLQVVVGLQEPGVDYTGAEFAWSSSDRVPNPEPPPPASPRVTVSCSPPVTVRSRPSVGGPTGRCATV